jgi:hypothetical protein
MIFLPFTCKYAVWFMAPAAFLATQVYAPELSACMDSMLSILVLLDELTEILSLSIISVSLKYQTMDTGESPFITVHVTDVKSPAFAVSSPNVNGIS